MAVISPMITPSGAVRVGESTVVLPNPDRGLTDPIFRPGVARHPAATVILLEVRPRPAQTLEVRAPATSAVRRVTIPPLGSLTTLLELSPIPFAGDAALLFARLGAVPTFYLGVPSAVADDDLVSLGAPLASISAGSIFIGAVFDDGVTRIPSAWIRDIADVVAAIDPSNEWPALLDLFPADERRLIVLDHAGRPASGVLFQIRRRGDAAPSWTRGLPPGVFDLEQVVAADPLDGTITSLFQPAGQELEVRALFSGDAIPVQSLLEVADASSVQDEFVRIPTATGAARLHLQITDLGSWFPQASTPSSIARFHRGCRLEPLIDGIPAFKALVADLRRAAHADHGAQLTGWAFNRFTLDEDDGRDIVGIAGDILAGGGVFRLLATKFVQDEVNFNEFNDPVLVIPALILWHASVLTDLLAPLFAVHDRPAFTIAGTVTGFTIAALAPLVPRIIEALEPSTIVIHDMNDLTNGGPAIAIHARNPARLRDNPVGSTDLPLNLDAVTDHFGIWHNKSQLVKFLKGGRTEYSAYVGGLDINENRLDTPDHNAASPYHDVHCRLTGPVVRDAWISFNERWEFDRVRGGTPLDPIAAPALNDVDLPQQPERHLARIGRTYFGPNPDGRSDPLPFALHGERSIFDTLLAAIGNARRSIFIGEQYFASEGSVNPPHPAEGSYHAALLNAASPDKRLVIVLPFEGDQPWGERRRRRLLAELRDAWGSRMLVGFPQRRPSMPEGKTITATGRTRLLQDVSATDTHFRIGPDARVPKTPFWMWIDGELMLIHSTTRLQGSGPKDFITEVDVLRAATPGDPTRWLSTPRPHKAGAPVTHSRLGSIYVHSKIMVVDDIFVSIGSANLNRRGFFFDGEINAFAVPERLAASRDNPARALRTACWAQYLGIQPAMGEALLGDPVGSADFLLRSPFLGNRYTPLEAVDLKGQLRFVGNTLVADGGDMIKVFREFAGLATVEGAAERLFNQVFDPTSFVDPNRITETF
jgi:phosphatidylserine/phosphatidylglycerophosphate/cardiolipin synthase-like enzyme